MDLQLDAIYLVTLRGLKVESFYILEPYRYPGTTEDEDEDKMLNCDGFSDCLDDNLKEEGVMLDTRFESRRTHWLPRFVHSAMRCYAFLLMFCLFEKKLVEIVTSS